jgi:hypothetical protein
MTEGEYRVASFISDKGEQITRIKYMAAQFIDYILENQVDARCAAVACTEIESAAMWGVKSITKPQRE